MVPRVDLPRSRGRRTRPHGWWLEVTPGTVALRAGITDGWEPWGVPGPDLLLPSPTDHEDQADELPPFDGGEHPPLVAAAFQRWQAAAGRGEITVWSRRSRARMVRTLASLDWDEWSFHPATAWAMLTLTYPGDWRAVCPDGLTLKRHFEALRRSLARHLAQYLPRDRSGKRSFVAIWKREFQARGAPHLHIGTHLPTAPIVARVGMGGGPGPARELTVHELVSLLWARIVGAEGQEFSRHLLAGTGVDFAEGARQSDPRRLALYFLGHSGAHVATSKEYQHQLPADWPDAGRWWGVQGVRTAAVEVPVDRSIYVAARRLLRAHSARTATHLLVPGTGWVRFPHPVTRRVRVPRTDTRTGAIHWRWVTRRQTHLNRGHVQVDGVRTVPGGWVVANDAPGLASSLGRYLSSITTTTNGDTPCATSATPSAKKSSTTAP